ncbi:MAG: hypothetical protein Q8S33_36890 [Myxococcales bacterium]|nr:hypothetical protein [Myxococcales bacterium]MDP3505978.1 hypothetical protein [Myxococcales bacterium]
MRSLSSVVVLVVVSACGFTPLGGETTLLPVVKRPIDTQKPTLSAVAVVQNALFRDACSYPIVIGETTYAPSAATRALVEAVAAARGETKVNLTYRVTGLEGSVECLWGPSSRYPEIEIVAITVIDDVLTDVGSIENGLAYDGCSYPITIGMTTYAPSAASKALVESIASKKYGDTNVRLTFRLPGTMASVECGWGGTQELPEIEVLTLTVLTTTGNVIIHNELPFDGCSYPIELNGVRYAPSAASAGLVESFATRVGANEATIDYELTGASGLVKCGWGGTQSLPEVDVLAIRPRS